MEAIPIKTVLDTELQVYHGFFDSAGDEDKWSINGSARLALIDDLRLTLNVLYELCKPRPSHPKLKGAPIKVLSKQEEDAGRTVMKLISYLQVAKKIDWRWYNKQIRSMEQPKSDFIEDRLFLNKVLDDDNNI